MAVPCNRHPKFTPTELIIVGCILAALAAVVVPEFSNAGALARASDLDRSVQILRSQVGKYKIEHHDLLPGDNAGTFDVVCFWKQLTCRTDDGGALYDPTKSKSGPFGPYLPNVMAMNLYSSGPSLPVVRDGITDPPTALPGTDFYFNFSDHSGKVWPALDAQGTPGR